MSAHTVITSPSPTSVFLVIIALEGVEIFPVMRAVLIANEQHTIIAGNET